MVWKKSQVLVILITADHRLTPPSLQVVEVKPATDRPAKHGGKAQKTAECVVGDETGTILFTARNEQGTFGNNRVYF